VGENLWRWWLWARWASRKRKADVTCGVWSVEGKIDGLGAAEERRRGGGRSEEKHGGESRRGECGGGESGAKKKGKWECEGEKVGEGGISEGGRKRGRMRRERGRPLLYLSAEPRKPRPERGPLLNHFASTLQAAPGYRRRCAACARYPRPRPKERECDPRSTPEVCLRQVALSWLAPFFPFADALARLRVCLPLLLLSSILLDIWQHMDHQPSLINPHGSPMTAEAVQRQFPL
jgi:hypothetical protein